MNIEQFFQKETYPSLKWQAYVTVDFSRAQMAVTTGFETLSEAGQRMAREKGLSDGDNVTTLVQVSQDSKPSFVVLPKGTGLNLNWLKPEQVSAKRTDGGTTAEKASKCFVATAAFGSPHAIEVRTLRIFRDHYLRRSVAGTALIHIYEAIGPLGARLLHRHPGLKTISRLVIRRVSRVIQRRMQNGLL